MITLDHFSDRSLNLIGAMLLGQEVRVFLSDRLPEPLVVALESRSIALRPHAASVRDKRRANLYDLCLGARLLRHRADGKARGEANNRLPGNLVRQWVRQENRLLQEDFTNILDLPGYHHPAQRRVLPTVVWRELPFNDLKWDEVSPGGLAMDVPPGLSFENIEGDFPGFLSAIRAGKYPLEHLPDFPLPVATIPIKVSVSQAYPAELEHLEASLNETRYLEEDFTNCYVRKSEGILETQLNPTRYLSGAALDHARLPAAVVAQRRGLPVRLFRNKDREEHHPVFQPRDHLALHALDLNSLHGTFARPGWSPRHAAFLSRIFERLDVDFALVGFADRVIDAGFPVYLHFPLVLKSVADPYDGAFWSRLAHVVLGKALQDLPGEPAAYHPLHLRTADTIFKEEEKKFSHVFRCFIWGALHGMPPAMDQFHSSDYWRQTARKIDRQLENWKRDYPGARWDNDFIYLPRELKEAGSKGGAVARSHQLS